MFALLTLQIAYIYLSKNGVIVHKEVDCIHKNPPYGSPSTLYGSNDDDDKD
jgi:hypothetical protein